MPYTVVWLPTAQNELARIWLQAPDKQRVTAAANRIDQMLASAASSLGQAHGSRRRVFIAPLEVIFQVSPDDCLVEVIRVDYIP
jgi:plasmid stabilization system protein ParE